MSDRERVYLNDTAPIEARLVGEDGINTFAAESVSWRIKKPSGTELTGGPSAVDQTEADIFFVETDEPGVYSAQVTFTLDDTSKRSTVLTFEVVDPLEITSNSTTPLDKAVDRAWMKLEDLFDSELGGPHLRDVTRAHMDWHKMKRLLPDALYYINNFYQPATGYTDESFPFDAHAPLLSQALLVESVYHLMRSYVEQPAAANAPVGYFDRRDYLNRWKLILDGEEKKLFAWLDLFKRDQMGLGTTSMLVGGYASHATRYPRYMRGRYPYYVFR